MPGAHCIPLGTNPLVLGLWDTNAPGQAAKGGAEKSSCSLPSQVDVVWTQISGLRHNLSLKFLKNKWVGGFWGVCHLNVMQTLPELELWGITGLVPNV